LDFLHLLFPGRKQGHPASGMAFALQQVIVSLLRLVPRFGFLDQDLVGVVFQGLGLGQESESLLNLGVPVGQRAQTLRLTKLNDKNLLFDADLQPVHHAVQVGIGPVNVLAGEIFFELRQHRRVHLEVLVHGAVGQINRGEMKENILHQQRVLEVVALGAFDLLVRGDAAAAVNGAASVGELDLAVGVVRWLRAAVGVVVIERDAGVVALDEAAGGRVVVVGGQRQGHGVVAEVVDGLHEALAE